MPCCEISDRAQMSKTNIAVRHFALGGRESLETAVTADKSINTKFCYEKICKLSNSTLIVRDMQTPKSRMTLIIRKFEGSCLNIYPLTETAIDMVIHIRFFYINSGSDTNQSHHIKQYVYLHILFVFTERSGKI